VTKNKQLLLALVAGVAAVVGNNFYVNQEIEQYKPKEYIAVFRAKKPIKAGVPLTPELMEVVRIPKNFAPKSALREEERSSALGQPVNTSISQGDYLLNTYFSVQGAVGDRLSQQVDTANFRAVSLPVDETNSLARSIETGDRIDIIFTFSLPGIASKFSTLLLQNVPVIATGSYSAAEQELGGRGTGRYNSLTLRLAPLDAMRLNYARQNGQISILLRKQDDNSAVELKPIMSLKDILPASEQEAIEKAVQQAANSSFGNEKFKEQVRELLEKQRLQGPKG
jgi:pilus assembly protein CpaB